MPVARRTSRGASVASARPLRVRGDGSGPTGDPIVRVARARRDQDRRGRAGPRRADADAGRAPRLAPRPPRVRALRASPLDPRPGQGPGPRGHGRVDRQHRPRLARRAHPQRAAVPRARADLRRRARQRRAARDGVVDQHPLRAAIGERARRRDQRHLPRRPTRPHPRRATPARGPACCASRAT